MSGSGEGQPSRVGGPLGRRRFLKGPAAAGAVGLWAPPLVESLLVPSAAASAPSTPTSPSVVVSGLGYPLGLAVVPGGPVYVADFGSFDGQSPGRILTVDAAIGSFRVVFSSADVWSSDVKVDAAANVYFTDYGWDPDDGASDASPSGRVLSYPLNTGTGGPTLGTPSVVAGTGAAVTGGAPLPAQPVPPGTPVAEVTVFVAFGLAVDGS